MFMNRVHEQCPKILTQENTESNWAKNRPSAQPKASPRAQPALPHACPRLPPRLAACAPCAYSESVCRTRHARLRVRPCPRACHPRPARPSACAPSSLAQRPAQLPSLAIYLGSSPKFNFSAQIFFFHYNYFFFPFISINWKNH